MGLLGPGHDERLRTQLAQQQATFDEWMVHNEERQQKLLAEQWQVLQQAKQRADQADELEKVREDVIRRQLRLVEQWEQLYVRIERLVARWETRDTP